MKQSRIWWSTLPVLVCIAFISLCTRTIAVAAPSKDITKNLNLATSTSEQKVMGIPDLYRACSCESSGSVKLKPKQYDANGIIERHNTNGSTDYGACQDNSIWSATASKLGLDYVNNIQDNYALALYIYKTQGISAWKWSYDPQTRVCRWEEAKVTQTSTPSTP